MKKAHIAIVSLLTVLVWGTAAVALASTDCDSQAKPALDCPTGYSMMCSPVGGAHWGCGKLSGGVIVESQSQPPLIKATSDVQVRADVNENGSARLLPTVNKVDSGNDTERLLPTVNKVDSGDSPSARLLPTVNKKTGESKVTVRGWDPEKQKEIVGTAQAEADSNSDISSVEIAEDSVNVGADAPARLFGFIPIIMHLDISADQNGRVKVKFPWFGFLVSSDYGDIGSQAEHVYQHNQTDLEFLRTAATSTRQIQIFVSISNVLKTKHDTVKNSINNVR